MLLYVFYINFLRVIYDLALLTWFAKLSHILLKTRCVHNIFVIINTSLKISRMLNMLASVKMIYLRVFRMLTTNTGRYYGDFEAEN